jgi:hypothetical protein
VDNQILSAFKSVLSVKESLESSMHDLRSALSSQQADDADVIEFLMFAAGKAPLSNAQLMQDLWVLYELNQKRGGYFVEFGACDGVTHSNTLLLEKVFGWRGALAEPARGWHEKLRANRDCYITGRCIHRQDGHRLPFHETAVPELSTLDEFSNSDYNSHLRQGGARYDVETISLHTLLRDAGAPGTIDYMSVDTEGREYEILSQFDFGAYDIRLVSVEHNFSSRRAAIHDLMVRHGYRRKFEILTMFDDWYVKVDGGTASPPTAA